MRAPIALFAVLVLSSGCTHTALERRTVNQASTMADLQFHQVLDNLAMFACNPDALAWHLKLAGGTIQVTDQGTGSLLQTFTRDKPAVFTPTFSAQRGVVNQWSGVPTIDANSLSLLQLAYQKALNPLDEDGTLGEALFMRICEIAVQCNIVLTRDTLNKAIDINSTLDEVRKAQLKRKNEDLHEQLDRAFEHVARLNRPITDAQIDNYAMRLANKITEDTRGESRARLQIQQEQQRVALQQARVFVEDEIVRLTRDICRLPFIPRYPISGRTEHNPQDIEVAQDQIRALLELAESPKFATPWVSVGKSRSDLPARCGYVGYYRKGLGGCYVGVTTENLGTLRDFTLIVLTMAPIPTQESPPGFPAGGITFSPTLSGGIR